jgi:hypothetical protein
MRGRGAVHKMLQCMTDAGTFPHTFIEVARRYCRRRGRYSRDKLIRAYGGILIDDFVQLVPRDRHVWFVAVDSQPLRPTISVIL